MPPSVVVVRQFDGINATLNGVHDRRLRFVIAATVEQSKRVEKVREHFAQVMRILDGQRGQMRGEFRFCLPDDAVPFEVGRHEPRCATDSAERADQVLFAEGRTSQFDLGNGVVVPELEPVAALGDARER